MNEPIATNIMNEPIATAISKMKNMIQPVKQAVWVKLEEDTMYHKSIQLDVNEMVLLFILPPPHSR